MRMSSTPEQTASAIWSIFVGHFKSYPGHGLRISNFLAVWHSRGLQFEDFKLGMVFATEKEWVEVIDGGISFRLSDAGFTEA